MENLELIQKRFSEVVETIPYSDTVDFVNEDGRIVISIYNEDENLIIDLVKDNKVYKINKRNIK